MPIYEEFLHSGVGQGDSTDHGSIVIALSVVVQIRHTYARSHASSLSILFHPILVLVGAFIRPWNLPTAPQQPQPNPTRAPPLNIIPPIQRNRNLTMSLTLSNMMPPARGEVERLAGVDGYGKGVGCVREGAYSGIVVLVLGARIGIGGRGEMRMGDGGPADGWVSAWG